MADTELERKRNIIWRVYRHNDHARRMASCNQAYLGSLAQHNLRVILGGRMVLSLDEAISNAHHNRLDKAIDYLREHGYLKWIGEE